MPSESRLPSASYTSRCRARSRRPSNFGDTISTLKCVSASAAPVGLPACTRHVSGAFTTQINAPHAGQHRVRTGRNESHARSTFGLLRVLADAAATLQRRKRLQHDGGALSVPWPRAQSDCAPYAADRTPRGLKKFACRLPRKSRAAPSRAPSRARLESHSSPDASAVFTERGGTANQATARTVAWDGAQRAFALTRHVHAHVPECPACAALSLLTLSAATGASVAERRSTIARCVGRRDSAAEAAEVAIPPTRPPPAPAARALHLRLRRPARSARG